MRNKTILFSSAILFASLFTLADTAKTSQPTRRQPTQAERIAMRIGRPSTSHRPQAPSRQRIGCEYDGQVLALDFVYPEGECNVTLTEYYSGAQQSYVVDSSDCYAEIPVGQIYESTLTLTTPSGTTYTCELTAD